MVQVVFSIYSNIMHIIKSVISLLCSFWFFLLSLSPSFTHTHTHPNIHRSGEKAEPGCGWAEAEVMGATVVLSWLLLSSQGSRKQSCQLRVRLGEEVLRKRNLKV